MKYFVCPPQDRPRAYLRWPAWVLAPVIALGLACGGSVQGVPNDTGAEPPVTGKTGLDKTATGGGQNSLDGGSDVRRDASVPRADAAISRSGDAGLAASADKCPSGAPRALNRVRFYPTMGRAAALLGGTFQGSNTSETNDFVDLVKIEQPPVDGVYTELTFANDKVYRYIKYYSPKDSYGSIAELEFYHDDIRLTGQGFGTASSVAGVSYALALDGETATAFQGSLADGNYIGLDIGSKAVVQDPTFSPAAGALASPSDITIRSGTPGAKIRYTLDGSSPSASAAADYAGPVKVTSGRVTISAVASADCLFDSQVVQATYSVGASAQPVGKGLKSYHIGNSLTDTINPWLEPIADSTGVDHTFARWTIPGATVKYIWEHKGDGVGTPQAAADYDSWVKSYAPIDHLTIQPFADPSLTFEGAAGTSMYTGVLAQSPDVQLWIYAQWASPRDWAKDPLAIGASWANPAWSVPTAPSDWATATDNQRLYYEAYRQYVDDNAGGKRVLVIPAGSALVELKRQVEAGMVPGISDFFGYSFQDELHLTKPVQYLVALVFYSCFYKQPSEGRVAVPAELGLTDAQAKIFQRIAWSVASAYPLSGITSP
ncbi:MAG: hypothetical protein JWN48_4115 [Myxococcaceae bacterium]|nr:hypothetical protein [Myxococcaceae bacterium]